MTADLESMKAAGLGNLVFLEVDIDEPPGGPVAFMSPKWQELFVQSVATRNAWGSRSPSGSAGLVWQRRTLGQAGASHAAPRFQFG